MKEKSKKKSKHSKSSKHNKKTKEKRRLSSETPENAPILTMTDYFNTNKLFRYYLVNEKKKNFESFTSAEAHEQFKKFIKLYNKRKLSSVYYTDGIDPESLHEAIKSSHKWNINMTGNEKKDIATITSSTLL